MRLGLEKLHGCCLRADSAVQCPDTSDPTTRAEQSKTKWSVALGAGQKISAFWQIYWSNILSLQRKAP
jgi:hypothetical protein